MAESEKPLLPTENKDQKCDLEPEELLQPTSPQRQRQSVRAALREYFCRILPASVLAILLFSLVRHAFIDRHHWCPGKGLREERKLVPLEAHIMSKCPDAKDCLEKLVVPAMVNVSDKVDFRLSYIGRYVFQLPRVINHLTA
jgi:hypothetical protein